MEMEKATTGRMDELPAEHRLYDIVVVGGGMAGIAAAVTAARARAHVALIQDRPVLGGNASSEIRVNLEGANGSAHNRYFVESGLAEDLLLLNFWRNPTGSADHWSALLLDLVLAEKNIDLYLDTVVHRVTTSSTGAIVSVDALTLASERRWTFAGDYFVDATGDATVAFLAGAAYMYGEEARAAFDEPLAPLEATSLTLGGTMQFMCKDVGRPVSFEPPAFARKITRDELRVNRVPDVWQQAPVLGGFWWIEYGGRLDTIRDNPDIKTTLLAEVYGVWDYIKNSPEWREKNATLDLEWVAALPGKRESRRVIGDYVLTEHDITRGARFEDAVAFGGWSIDRHAPGGFLDVDVPPCVQVHLPSVYQIPLRCLYARDVPNLFLAGRDISCSHVACCSTRVMLTCTHCGEAVGAAAALSVQTRKPPREIAGDAALLCRLRQHLQRSGHYIPFVPIDVDRVPCDATVSSSSDGCLEQPAITGTIPLTTPRMLSLPLTLPRLDAVGLWLQSADAFDLHWRVYERDARGTWLPGAVLAAGTLACPALPGGDWVDVPVGLDNLPPGYVHVAFAADRAGVSAGISEERPLGPLTWKSQVTDLDRFPLDRRAAEGWSLPQMVAEFGDSAAYVFGYWRRDSHGWGGPPGPSIAFRTAPEHIPGAARHVLEPYERPTLDGIHAWVSARCEGASRAGKFVFDEPQWLCVEFPEPVHAEACEIYFNSDVERHLANLWYAHPPGERAMTTLVADAIVEARLPDGTWAELEQIADKYRRRREVVIGHRISALRVTCLATYGECYASIVDLRLRQ